MNPSHFPQTRPRSRSNSPMMFAVEKEDHDEDEVAKGSASHDKDIQAQDNELRANSWLKQSKLNQRLVNSHPVHLLVNTDDSAANNFNFTSHNNNDQRPLICNPRHRRHSDGEMNDLLNGGLASTYGTINSTSPTPSQSDDTRSTTASNEGCTTPNGSRLKRQKSYYTPSMVDELRKRNRLYFLDPITKLRHFHGFPWKLTLQIFKIILITGQIVIFGGQRYNIVEYFERSEIALDHLLMKSWEPGYETMPYPPATGQYAIYTKPALFNHMNNLMEQYYLLPKNSLASLRHIRDKGTNLSMPLRLCFRANDFVDYANGTYFITDDILKNCTYILPYGEKGNYTYNVAEYLKEIGFSLPFNRTLDISITFSLTTFHMDLLKTHYGPTCYNVSVKVLYDNKDRSGQLVTSLKAVPVEMTCKGQMMTKQAKGELQAQKTRNILYDSFVMAICVLSTILCSRSLHRSNKLRIRTAKYFKLHRGKPFSFSNHMEYINVWYIIIIINDILTVFGSAFKIQLEMRVFNISSKNYQLCSIFLGLGIFLTYIGILRYLGFFKSYNVLILTLKTSFPHVMRFLVCAICLYTGFLFCGWVVFSPYHIKFRKLSTASECLFSLVNGDDMFVTFSALTTNDNAIWYFHRAYLYTFISLFIYVVLSVFIAVIMDNYENLKYWNEKGFPDTDVQNFIKEDGGMTQTELFSHVRRGHTCQNWFFCIFPCLSCFRSKQKEFQGIGERPSLISTI